MDDMLCRFDWHVGPDQFCPRAGRLPVCARTRLTPLRINVRRLRSLVSPALAVNLALDQRHDVEPTCWPFVNVSAVEHAARGLVRPLLLEEPMHIVLGILSDTGDRAGKRLDINVPGELIVIRGVLRFPCRAFTRYDCRFAMLRAIALAGAVILQAGAGVVVAAVSAGAALPLVVVERPFSTATEVEGCDKFTASSGSKPISRATAFANSA
jgi:hypothetical protein